MKNPHVFWDKAAPKYAKKKIDNLAGYEATLARTATYLSDQQQVLEIGCGTGSTALLLANRVRHFTATDYSGGMIEIGARKAKDQGVTNIAFLQADVFDERLAPESFDVVMAHNLFHLLDNLPKTLERVSQLLKPDGLLISKTPCVGEMGPFIKMVLPVMKMMGKAPYVDTFKKSDLEAMVRDEGFEILEKGSYPEKSSSLYIVAKKG
ncbi:class I SAM-dependent methyltransferase [Hirschia litorea]|uniref:Class I SAM-dependent methyltransferase n=1 Tax=Hirschia litorea TaxID=1199156 RepID=A0ABW2IL82_9PROT